MIILHHLGRPHNAFALNRDLIKTVEANPDTVVTLTSGDRLLVCETPAAIADLVRDGRVEVLTRALERRGSGDAPRGADRSRQRSDAPLTVVEPTERPGGRRRP